MDSNLIGAKMNRETLPKLMPNADKAAIVVDGSGSRAAGNSVGEVQADAVALTRGLESHGTKVGVLTFSCDVGVSRTPEEGSAVSAVEQTFRGLQGASSMGADTALKTAGALVGPGGLVFMMTDGLLDPSLRKTVQGLESQGVRVVGVGQGRDNPKEMGSIFNEHYRLENQPNEPPRSSVTGREVHPGKLALFDSFQSKKTVLLLDTSGSRAHMRDVLDNTRQDAKELVAGMKRHNGTEVEVLQFSNRVLHHADNEKGSAIDQALNSPMGEGSDGLLALKEGAKLLGGPGTLVFMTDGEVGDPKTFRAEVARLKEEGIKVVAVGLSTDNSKDLGRCFDEHYRTSSRQPGYYLST